MAGLGTSPWLNGIAADAGLGWTGNPSFDGPRNQKVTKDMGSKGNGRQIVFLFQFAGRKNIQKKAFSSLDKAEKKVLKWRCSTENNC